MNPAAKARVRKRERSAHRRSGRIGNRIPTGEQQYDEAGSRRSARFAPLRWLRRGLSRLVRWVAARLQAQVPRIGRLPIIRTVKHVGVQLGRLGKLVARASEGGFGFWWLVATVATAVALGMLVAVLISPVAALIALLIVAIGALVRWHRRSRRSPMHAAAA